LETIRPGIDHHESAPPSVLFSDESKTGLRLVVAFHDDVLEKIAETRLDRPLIASVDVQVVGNRTQLANLAVCLHEHHPSRITEVATARLKLYKRRQSRLAARHCLFVRP
jgi:hypothetical protein